MNASQWQRGNAVGCGRDLAICEGAAVIARVVGCGYPIGVGNGPRSNRAANLIVHAPELLTTLESFVDAYDAQKAASATDRSKWPDPEHVTDARRIIAAAKSSD